MFQKSVSCFALSLIGLLTLGMPGASAIDVGVSPPRVELDLNSKSTRSNSITITNLSDKPAEMRAYVRNWTIDENNQLRDIASDEKSLDQWIIFTPSRFTIPPGKTQTLRFAVRPKVKPAPGEYRAVIYLEEVASDNQENFNGSINTVGRIGVVIYAHEGEIKRAGTVNSVTVDTKSNLVKAVFDVSNQGNANIRVDGQYAIWRAANFPGSKATQPIVGATNPATKLPANVVQAGAITLSPVLPNHRRQLVLPLTKKLPPGNYVLDINANLSGAPIDTGIPFTVPAANTLQPTPKPVNSANK